MRAGTWEAEAPTIRGEDPVSFNQHGLGADFAAVRHFEVEEVWIAEGKIRVTFEVVYFHSRDGYHIIRRVSLSAPNGCAFWISSNSLALSSITC